ncbi:MAG: hypothetical protein ABIT81_03750 [Ferruginibacter sp.]
MQLYSFCYLYRVKELVKLKRKLEKGKLYRRSELALISNAVDRHLAALVSEGTLRKVGPGTYYYPRESVFGKVPADEAQLVSSFLKDDDFLLTSPNFYNALGVGTTQLYNKRIVYNHKRHGEFVLGNQRFYFQRKRRFPKVASPEFLMVDLLNNLDQLAEDKDLVLQKALKKLSELDTKKLATAVIKYGSIKTKKQLDPLLKAL